jgi:hypothetical protein
MTRKQDMFSDFAGFVLLSFSSFLQSGFKRDCFTASSRARTGTPEQPLIIFLNAVQDLSHPTENLQS